MNAYDRGDYNSSFALRAVELKRRFSHDAAVSLDIFCLFCIIYKLNG